MVGPVAVKHRLPETMRCHNVLLVKLYRVPEGEEPDISTPLIDVGSALAGLGLGIVLHC
jgi:hypothetical protein